MSTRDEPTDAELLRRAKRDPQAFDAIYVRHARGVQRWLASQVAEHIAWELTAETFARAWLSRRRFRSDANASGSAGPWLHGIARNLYREWARSQRIERSAVERLRIHIQFDASPPTDDDDLERLTAAALGPQLAASLDRLPADQRDAIQLRVIDELPYDEIAHRLDCTPDVVRMRVMRGLRSLNADLEGARP